MIDLIKREFNDLVSDRRFSEILKGSVWAISARIFAAGVTIITNSIVARIYGASAMGILAMISSYLVFITIFTVLGTNTSILRFIPEHVTKYSFASAFHIYRKILHLVAAFSVSTGIFLFFVSGIVAEDIFSKPHLTSLFALAAVFVIFKSLMLLNTQAVRGLGLIKTFAFMQVLPHLTMIFILILTTLFFYRPHNPVYSQLFAWCFAALAGAVIMSRFFKKQMSPTDQIELIPVKDILKISLPMFMTATLNLAIVQMGMIILAMFRSESEVGYYSVAFKLATLTTFVLQAVNSMSAPKFSSLFQRGDLAELFYIAKKSAKLIFWTTGPVLLFLVIFGKPTLAILFGSDFLISYPVLLILAIGQFVNSISGSTALFMNMTGHEKEFRNIVLCAALINITLNILLIPKFGMVGTALAGMSSVIFWNGYTLFYIKVKYGKTIGYFPRLSEVFSNR